MSRRPKPPSQRALDIYHTVHQSSFSNQQAAQAFNVSPSRISQACRRVAEWLRQTIPRPSGDLEGDLWLAQYNCRHQLQHAMGNASDIFQDSLKPVVETRESSDNRGTQTKTVITRMPKPNLQALKMIASLAKDLAATQQSCSKAEHAVAKARAKQPGWQEDQAVVKAHELVDHIGQLQRQAARRGLEIALPELSREEVERHARRALRANGGNELQAEELLPRDWRKAWRKLMHSVSGVPAPAVQSPPDRLLTNNGELIANCDAVAPEIVVTTLVTTEVCDETCEVEPAARENEFAYQQTAEVEASEPPPTVVESEAEPPCEEPSGEEIDGEERNERRRELEEASSGDSSASLEARAAEYLRRLIARQHEATHGSGSRDAPVGNYPPEGVWNRYNLAPYAEKRTG